MLVLYRVLQGLGGGMLMPLGMTILTRAAGPERVGRVMAVLGIPMLLGPIFGPIIGGALIDAVSWHWIFLINLPIGIAAIVYAWIVLPKDEVRAVRDLRLARHAPALARSGRCSSTASARSPSTAPPPPPRSGPGAPRPGADRGLRAVGAGAPQHPPAGGPAPVQEQGHDRRGAGDDAVRDRVLRRLAAVPALLHPGPRRGRPRRGSAAGPAGCRRDDHHADRRASWPTGSAPARSCSSASR